ncbi:hypothetical protein ACFL0Q_00135 [Thermodesulfobacteriota bacterium]
MDWDKVREEFIGKGKVQALKIEPIAGGKFRLYYREGKGTPDFIEADDKPELDKLLIEFGGKNPETVAAPDMFLTIQDWMSGGVEQLGHRLEKISLRGFRDIRNTSVPLYIPQTCGHPEILHSKKDRGPEPVRARILQKEHDQIKFTVCFATTEELDSLLAFLKTDQALRDFTWQVETLVTLALDSGRMCKWVRTTAGDGARRMVLELQRLDDTHYNNCVHHDLVCAADGMVGGECKKIPDKRRKQKEQLICEMHAKSEAPEPA